MTVELTSDELTLVLDALGESAQAARMMERHWVGRQREAWYRQDAERFEALVLKLAAASVRVATP